MKQPAPARLPPPNPDWRRSPARNIRVWVDPCDRSKGKMNVWEYDAMLIPELQERDQIMGVK